MGTATLIDGPLPFVDAAMLIGATALTVGVLGHGIYQAVKANFQQKAKAKAQATTSSSKDTTIRALNATGTVIAVRDGVTHVSVRAAPYMGTLQNWITIGSSHPCTFAVQSVVIKWDGGN